MQPSLFEGMHELTRKKLSAAAESIVTSSKWSVNVTTQSGEEYAASNNRIDVPPFCSLQSLRGYLSERFFQSADFEFAISHGVNEEVVARKHETELILFDCKPVALQFPSIHVNPCPPWLKSAMKYLPSISDINGAIRPEDPLATTNLQPEDAPKGVHIFFDKQWTAIELHDYVKYDAS